MSVIVIIGIGVGRYYWGKQTSSADKQENLSIIESSDEKDTPKSKWTGINSRDEVREKINGTIWESMEEDRYLGRWLRFVIHDDYVDQYYAQSTLNYDDPKDWHPLYQWKIYGVYEQQKGTYAVALEEVNNKFPFTFIFIRNNVVGFEWGEGENTGVLLNLVSE